VQVVQRRLLRRGGGVTTHALTELVGAQGRSRGRCVEQDTTRRGSLVWVEAPRVESDDERGICTEGRAARVKK
jgi:hypothetical protein